MQKRMVYQIGYTFFIYAKEVNGIALNRYSVIREKNPREIVLLRGRGCAWRRCTFCDYHLDASQDKSANLILNQSVLHRVTGMYGRLEVINSGSFPELDPSTIYEVERTCREKNVRELHIESHWMFRGVIPALRKRFAEQGIRLHVKIGVETFDADYRENILNKGIAEKNPEKIGEIFDDCCLLFGLPGQTAVSMINDIETGLAWFHRVCVNLMVPNTTKIWPDESVCHVFVNQVLPMYRENPRIDILLENTDFGVGEVI